MKREEIYRTALDLGFDAAEADRLAEHLAAPTAEPTWQDRAAAAEVAGDMTASIAAKVEGLTEAHRIADADTRAAAGYPAPPAAPAPEQERPRSIDQGARGTPVGPSLEERIAADLDAAHAAADPAVVTAAVSASLTLKAAQLADLRHEQDTRRRP